MKFCDEALSRVLTAHEAGELRRQGSTDFNGGFCANHYGCMNQFVYNEPNRWYAASFNPIAARWFDNNYDPSWSIDEFLRQLESQGLA